MVLEKHEIEATLYTQKKAIQRGQLKEDNPLDQSDIFLQLCEACRKDNDLKTCQVKIQKGVNVNSSDRFDYTPLILASLCGHYDVCVLLLESGALCERESFNGERCLYNALNDRIRNLLLSYDYSKARDPLQPLASHLASLLSRTTPQTSDITLTAGAGATSLSCHKFILAARSNYFSKKFSASPDTTISNVPSSIPSRSLEVAIQSLYLSELNYEFGADEEDQIVLAGIDKLGKQLELDDLLDTILQSDRRLQRQQRRKEVDRAVTQLKGWFAQNISGRKFSVLSDQLDDVKWDSLNAVFADVLLCATIDEEEEREDTHEQINGTGKSSSPTNDSGVPIDPLKPQRLSSSNKRRVLFPAHRAMLLRSPYFSTMFSSGFKEGRPSTYLPILHIETTPTVLSVILEYLYSESTSFGLDIAIDVLLLSDFLLLDKLKVKAATVISSLGNGSSTLVDAENPRGAIAEGDDELDIYEVVRVGWATRVRRLEEFGARFLAYRLEAHIDSIDFKQLVIESSKRIKFRQKTDTVELIDNIRFYLSERFRLRFEDAGIDDMTEEIEDARTDDLPIEDRLEIKETTTQDRPAITKDEASHDPGVIRTLDGDEVGDGFAQDALNYQILMGKIDALLESLDLDA